MKFSCFPLPHPIMVHLSDIASIKCEKPFKVLWNTFLSVKVDSTLQSYTFDSSSKILLLIFKTWAAEDWIYWKLYVNANIDHNFDDSFLTCVIGAKYCIGIIVHWHYDWRIKSVFFSLKSLSINLEIYLYIGKFGLKKVLVWSWSCHTLALIKSTFLYWDVTSPFLVIYSKWGKVSAQGVPW